MKDLFSNYNAILAIDSVVVSDNNIITENPTPSTPGFSVLLIGAAAALAGFLIYKGVKK